MNIVLVMRRGIAKSMRSKRKEKETKNPRTIRPTYLQALSRLSYLKQSKSLAIFELKCYEENHPHFFFIKIIKYLFTRMPFWLS
jgi:hypothetical protein